MKVDGIERKIPNSLVSVDTNEEKVSKLPSILEYLSKQKNVA